MAKTQVVGNAVVITSALALEEIKTVKKYRPEALTLMGGEDGKEPIFAISVKEGKSGDINKYGATFGGSTRDEHKLATITMCCEYDGEDVREWLADEIGGALINLEKLEKALPAVIKEINEERLVVMASIEVA